MGNKNIDNELVISNIKKLLKDKEISQRDFASRINITQSGLYQMLVKEDLKVSTLLKIANEFNIPITYFFSDGNEKQVISEEEMYKKIETLEQTNTTKDKIIEDLQFNVDTLKLNCDLLKRQIELINEDKSKSRNSK